MAFLALAACAAIANAITPKPRGWNNSSRRDPRTDPLHSLLLVLALAALVVSLLQAQGG